MSETGRPSAFERELWNAREFLDCLRPSNELWTPRGHYSCSWVFRGQANADWALQPSIWRLTDEDKTLMKPLRDAFEPQIRKIVQQVREYRREPVRVTRAMETILTTVAELQAVRSFEDLADSLGFAVGQRVPIGPVQFINEYAESLNVRAPEPSQSTALAQHHGVPTRLLDWSRKPLIAAFFAADGAMRQPAGSFKKLAVWALQPGKLTSCSALPFRVRTLTFPKHQMSFLHAQDGLFVWDVDGEHSYLNSGRWPRFEDLLSTAGQDVLRKYTLPVEEAPELLRLLAAEGISRAHLMPTLDNVSVTVKQSWSWLWASMDE